MAYVVMLGSLLTPIIIKRELNEMSILTVLLFVSIFAFIVLTALQLSEGGVNQFNSDFTALHQDPFFLYTDYMQPKFNFNLIKALSIILVSFECQ
jgi:amino acid permease